MEQEVFRKAVEEESERAAEMMMPLLKAVIKSGGMDSSLISVLKATFALGAVVSLKMVMREVTDLSRRAADSISKIEKEESDDGS